jgi:hypothetical protein
MVSQNSATGLRQKAINVIYLILLAMLFSLIDADFVDTVHHSNKSMNRLCSDIERESRTSNYLLLKYLDEDDPLYAQIKDELIEVDKLSFDVINYIENLKLKMGKVDSYNKNGYLRNGSKDNTSNKILIKQRYADSLVSELRNFKVAISNYVDAEEIETIYSILSLPPVLSKSNGQKLSLTKFYFNKSPLNVTMLNLTHFKSKVERIRIQVSNSILKKINSESKADLPFDVLQIIHDDGNQLGNSKNMEDFFDILDDQKLLQTIKDVKAEDPEYMYIQSETDSVYPAGSPIRFKVFFDSSYTELVNISIASSDGIQYFGLNEEGTFLYVPPHKGRYAFTFSNNTQVTKKNIKVIDVDPTIQSETYGSLYLDFDNPLYIKTSEFEDTEGLVARISNGKILKKGKNFYARVESPGKTKVEVYAKMPYGFVKVAEKEYIIRELQLPYATISNQRSGDNVSLSKLQVLNTMKIISEEYLLNESFYVSSFHFSKIYKDHSAILPPIQNRGSSINLAIKEVMLNSQVGDILIFENIQVKSSLGNEKTLAPLTLIVRE